MSTAVYDSRAGEACVVVAGGRGTELELATLTELFATVVGVRGAAPVGAGALSTNVSRLRPGRWVARLLVANDASARKAVSRLRSAGYSAVLGPPDESHERGFANRNRPTEITRGATSLSICFPWAVCKAGLIVEIDPGPAFGAGSHPSTVLAARVLAGALLDRRTGTPGSGPSSATVIDVGCGSGVLALIAARCGAAKVLGVDISPAAVAAAQHNARLNGLEAVTSFATTSVANLVGAGCATDAVLPQGFDVVVANIGAEVLDDLAPYLVDLLTTPDLSTPGGLLVLSGISAPQASRLRARFESFAVTFEALCRLDDWCALVGQKQL